jgi:hypothetical protein
MNSDDEIREIIRDCADICGKALTPGALGWYVDALRDIAVDRLRRAIGVWMATSRFFPTPSEILEINARLPLSAEAKERARQKLLARIDWNPEVLPSVLDHPETQITKHDDVERRVAGEVAAERGEATKARIAELRRQAEELLRRDKPPEGNV